MLTRDDVLRTLQIAPGDFVVEVGGGHNPFGRTDLMFEKYPFDSEHRTDSLVCNAPVIIADAIRLPLPDKGCDLLFASHVLEHVAEPQAFLEEIKRCSRRVYLEFPSLKRELMFSWSFHQWLIEVHGSHLVFYRHDLPQLFGDFFHRHYDFVLDAWSAQRHAALNNWIAVESDSLTWEFAPQGLLQYVVESSPRDGAKVNWADLEPVRYTWKQTLALSVQGLLPGLRPGRGAAVWRQWRHGGPKAITQAVVDWLACQQCHGTRLRLGAADIVCETCGRLYPQRKGLFDFDVTTAATADPPVGAPQA